ncbi:bis(5'-nucleosyl)-tetraphosphatase (symmetrical) YqeK [Candidatus Poribacteria bacterium]|nr:bis(5'-nucleosyl)-tetraphosphatase (symmetrical) YqeK [Candidatus Poribacteria bacterium]
MARRCAEEHLKGRLLEHTRGCVEMAQKLARRFGLDADKAATAAYLHDITKAFSLEQQTALLQKLGMSPAELASHLPAVVHGWLSALIAKRELGIDDPEVLQAIEAHSTGCAGMSDLSKVVFISDFIEHTRRFPKAAELRGREYPTLDEAVITILRRKLEYLLEGRAIVDRRAIECWNELVERARQKET